MNEPDPLFSPSLRVHLHAGRMHYRHRAIGTCHTVLACPADPDFDSRSIQLAAQPSRNPSKVLTQTSNTPQKLSLHDHMMLDLQLIRSIDQRNSRPPDTHLRSVEQLYLTNSARIFRSEDTTL